MAETITTERMLLRAFRPDDAEAIYRLCKVPELGINAGWKPHENIAESKIVLEQIFLGQQKTWAMTDLSTGELIGSIGLMPDTKRDNPRANMIGYWLGKEWWGQGLMAEAVTAVLEYGFGPLGLDLISAYCYPGNDRSLAVLEKAGFAYEGKLLSAEVSWDGRVLHHICFRLTAEDYFANLLAVK